MKKKLLLQIYRLLDENRVEESGSGEKENKQTQQSFIVMLVQDETRRRERGGTQAGQAATEGGWMGGSQMKTGRRALLCHWLVGCSKSKSYKGRYDRFLRWRNTVEARAIRLLHAESKQVKQARSLGSE